MATAGWFAGLTYERLHLPVGSNLYWGGRSHRSAVCTADTLHCEPGMSVALPGLVHSPSPDQIRLGAAETRSFVATRVSCTG